MYELAKKRLARLVSTNQAGLMTKGRVGLEKECLRVSREGRIANTPHPNALGSALTNPYVTTDYSEALLELITPPLPTSGEALEFLRDVQQFVYGRVGDELLWSASMPGVVAGEQSIPIAQYGTSNAGMMKTVYRRGLGFRYGRIMQVIAGVHFNYSFSDEFWHVYQELEENKEPFQDFVSAQYFAVLRNLQRFGWLVPYLFGASPAVCKSFLNGRKTSLDEFDRDTYYEPYATSLRMGDIGYQNNKENEIGVKACYDSLQEYVDTLKYAIETPYPGYEKIGVKVDGVYRQLNPNILQIENEYYSTVRPKQLLVGNEKPIVALNRRGVRYIELRSVDVSVFEPTGIGQDQLHFLEALTLFCLLHESPRISPWERAEIDRNEMLAAHRGREPNLGLKRNGQELPLRVWAGEICSAMEELCAVLDDGLPDQPYSRALAIQKEAVADPECTPSARMLREMRTNHESFFNFAHRMSQQHRRFFAELEPNPSRMEEFAYLARESLRRQEAIENEDNLSFDAYLEQYFAQG